jgi:uncharacterized repeat protein (TIGR01451 family)
LNKNTGGIRQVIGLISRPHPPQSNKISGSRKWYKVLAATFLLSSGLQTTIVLPTQGQQTGASVTPGRVIDFFNQADYSYTFKDPDPVGGGTIPEGTIRGSSNPNTLNNALVDPFGQILGCSGIQLSDYTGFSVALYAADPSDPTGTELGSLLALTKTEVPDVPGNGIPGGREPNVENSNPYFLTNNPAGAYNFWLDSRIGQTDVGKTYILVVNPPANSIYQQRRIQIKILANTPSGGNTIVSYLASSLDGQPISSTGQTQVEVSQVLVNNAEIQGLRLLAFQLTANMCQPNQVRIVKTGDRATAEPGDTVIYRLSIKNLSDTTLKNVVITDSLPLGFRFLPQTVRAESGGQVANISSESNGNTITFKTDINLATNQVLNLVYAVQLTNDAQRGTGRNSAIVNAQRIDNNLATKDGPASHTLKIRPGITSDCGTIIGRVFVDKNFDGEQQPGEAGVPNAVIFLEDGNRITTDANGLFSLANVLPGYHTGVIDLSSLPGYTLAPNQKFSERNSQSRLVRLEPGGLVRMNFALTPSFQEQVEK